MQIEQPKDTPVIVRFDHGLGDAANFAHSLPLWTRRGFDIRIHTADNKKELFEAAGVSVVDHHDRLHPPAQPANMMNGWAENKCGWNLTQAPMPYIGSEAELWEELLGVELSLKNQLSKESKKQIDTWLKTLPSRPILIHSRANTSAGMKNLSDNDELDLYKHLLKKTDNTLVLLDWDNRVKWFHHMRIRHLSEFRGLTVPELWYLMECSALLIGVDSGPLHTSRFSTCPVLGLWSKHHPCKFALPRAKTLHLVEAHHGRLNSLRRHSYNLADVDRLDGATIAGFASRMVEGVQPSELVWKNVLEKVNTSNGNRHMDRGRTIGAALASNPTRIIETGTMRALDDWTAGGSTYLIGMWLKNRGSGELNSVDLSPANVKFAREHTEPFADFVKIHEGDSLDYLSQAEKADLIYLDSLDTDEPGCAEHGLAEAKLAAKLTSMILIDDCALKGHFKGGKGELAVPFLLAEGWKIHPASGYQILMTKPTPLASKKGAS